MSFLDTVIIYTGQHELLAGFYQAGLDLPDPEPFGDRLAAVYDPDGNIIGLVQRDKAGSVQEI